MRSGDDSLERLRAAIQDLVATDAGEVVAEARAEARARVRSMLSDAMSHSLLESIEERLALPNDESPGSDQSWGPGAADPARSIDRPEVSGIEEPAWYVYGVVGSVELEPHDGLTGVDATQPVTTLHEGSLAAIVSQVPSDEFDDARLRAHLADMDWVEKLARAHESVLDLTRRHATVVPMRMCTVYRTEGGVRELLRREAAAFEEALARLEGKSEWGVKVFADRTATAAADVLEDPVSDSSGSAYMDRRRRDLERHEQAAGRVQEAALGIHERLHEMAVDGLVAPPQRPEASGYRGEMVLNGVYLIEDDAADAFDVAVSDLQDEFGSLGLKLVLTGPWPAYNFVPDTIGAAW